jgi:hypothetical protein
MIKNRPHFCLTVVKPANGSCLRLTFADGAKVSVDLADWIATAKSLQPLANGKLFATARIGSYGRAVEFGNGDIDLAADNLRNLAVEQSGGIGHERIWNWMHDNNLTIDKAAEVLGISRRMLNYYRNGEKTIPRHIWLACVGWETLRQHGEAA